MKRILFKILIISTFLTAISCSDQDEVEVKSKLTQEDIITYFQEIALGFEYGDATEITRKWETKMSVYLDGNPSSILVSKVNQTINDINELVTDGFLIEVVDIEYLANCQIYFGSVDQYNNKFPDEGISIESNYALGQVWWRNNVIHRARIFIDTERSNQNQQESFVLEEITQSLGFGKDSPRYPNSVFYETPYNGGFVTEYSELDKLLIRLLYHPLMTPGLNKNQTEIQLKKIFEEDSTLTIS